MKKILVVIVMSMFLFTVFSVFTVADEEKTSYKVTLSYSFETPVIENEDINGSVYVRLEMKDAPCGGNSGEPRLPGRGVYILIPQGETVSDITVSYSEKICLGSGYVVEPVEESIPLPEIEMNSAPLIVPNKVVYKSEEPFPGRLFTKVGVYGFRGYNILVLKLHPVQYIPSTGELFYYPDLSVSVETVEDDNINGLFRGLEKDKLEVMRIVDNPTVVNTYLESNSNSFSIHSESYDLLIITTDSLKDGFEPLAQVHNSSGVKTIIKTLSEIDCNTPEDIRDFIKDAYNNWGIEYVLIGGDHDLVPARMFYFGDWVDDYGQLQKEWGPSDLYYSGLDGPSTPPGDLYEPNGFGYYYAEADPESYGNAFVVGLFTPSLDLTGYSAVNLSFECSFDRFWWADNFGKVNAYSGGISLDNFEENLLEVIYYDENITLTFDPSEYNDPSNVFIEFYYNDSDDTGSFNIDDICVEAGSKGINEKLILQESFEGDVFPPAGWTQVKYSEEGEWTREYYRFKADFLADVYVGRACVGNATEVENFVDKTIEYMNTNTSDPYLKKVLLAGEYLGFLCIPGGRRLNEVIGTCREGYKTVGFPPLKYDIQKLYDRNIFFENKLLQWKTFQIINRINKNVHVINHDGHSDYHYNMRIYIPDVDKLTNDKYFFVYSQGCNAGGFDNGDCVAEHLTVKTSHGAFAGIWNARFGWFLPLYTDGESQRYHREFWDAVFGENITVISKANEDSKVDNLWRINDGYMKWVCYGLNLLGDPTVQFKYLGSENNQNSQNSQQQSNNQQTTTTTTYISPLERVRATNNQ